MPPQKGNGKRNDEANDKANDKRNDKPNDKRKQRAAPDPNGPKAPKKGEKWTEADKAFLLKHRQGDPDDLAQYRAIAEKLGRTDLACRLKYHQTKKKREAAGNGDPASPRDPMVEDAAPFAAGPSPRPPPPAQPAVMSSPISPRDLRTPADRHWDQARGTYFGYDNFPSPAAQRQARVERAAAYRHREHQRAEREREEDGERAFNQGYPMEGLVFSTPTYHPAGSQPAHAGGYADPLLPSAYHAPPPPPPPPVRRSWSDNIMASDDPSSRQLPPLRDAVPDWWTRPAQWSPYDRDSRVSQSVFRSNEPAADADFRRSVELPPLRGSYGPRSLYAGSPRDPPYAPRRAPADDPDYRAREELFEQARRQRAEENRRAREAEVERVAYALANLHRGDSGATHEDASMPDADDKSAMPPPGVWDSTRGRGT